MQHILNRVDHDGKNIISIGIIFDDKVLPIQESSNTGEVITFPVKNDGEYLYAIIENKKYILPDHLQSYEKMMEYNRQPINW